MIAAFIMAAAFGAAETAAPSELPPLTPVDVKVGAWAFNPLDYYPKGAQAREVEGHTISICVVTPVGKLADCRVTVDEPAGYRFGEAALKTARFIKIAKTARDGSPTAGRRFELRMDFRLPK